MFETHRAGPFLSEHCFPIYKQLLVDIHPIFGAYVLYLRALQLYVCSDLQGTMDHLNFAMEWIVSWRIPGNRGDLTEQVHLKWRIANRKIHQSMNNLRKFVRIEKTTDCRGLWYFRAEHWMADITAADV
jgi:hypothetical protein